MFEVGPDHDIGLETRFENRSWQRDKKDLMAEVASFVGIPTCCPRCHHPGIRSWGRSAGLPRYRSRGCKRSFGPLTDTPLATDLYPYLRRSGTGDVEPALRIRSRISQNLAMFSSF